MDVAQVLHMNGGAGEASYANNSLLQQRVFSLTKHIREEAITSLYSSTLPRSLAIADLGCSSGPNTFIVVSETIKTVEKLCRELNHKSPEYMVLMNDLPGNDFNNVFKSLSSFKENLSNEMETKNFYGIPGSFYGRIFPPQSLHFVHSSYSLHWLSKGIIKEDQVDTFNTPNYFPSPSEVKLEVLNEGSFTINHLQVSEVNWNVYDNWNAFDFESGMSKTLGNGAYNVAQCMRAVAEPLLVSHFGEAIIEEVFSRLQEILVDRMSKEKTKYTIVTISLTRKS